MNKLLADAIEAHGGYERWKQNVLIEVDLRTGGELIEKKGSQPTTMHIVAKLSEQITWTTMANATDRRMVFRSDRLAIETSDGKLIAERRDLRPSFAGHDLNTQWDAFQRGYFGGCAIWGYLTFPFSLAMAGSQIWDIDPIEDNGEVWNGIRVVLPEYIAAHSHAQEFYFAQDKLLRRQDYTLDIAGGVKVANYALDIVDIDGFKLPSKRHAYFCNKRYEPDFDRRMIQLEMSNFRIIDHHRIEFS